MRQSSDCFINRKSVGESFGTIFSIIAGTASIFGALFIFFSLPNKSVAEIYLILLSTLLILYIIYINTKKLHRYSQVLAHNHAINHIIRDALVELENVPIDNLTKETKAITESLVNIISSCYSMLSRRTCSVTLKEVIQHKGINYLNTIARDSTSSIQRNKTDNEQYMHKLDDNTDFSAIWYKKETGMKYFLCNNLKSEYLKNNYINTSFEKYDYPKIFHFLRIPFITKWTLPYNSTLIFPIQYMNNSGADGTIYGFLCIDSKSKNIFDSRYMVELGAAFADALYLYFSQIEETLEKATKP